MSMILVLVLIGLTCLATLAFATVSYSLTVSSDLVVASVFALNAVCCLAITCLVACRRVAVTSSGWLSR